MLTNSSFVLTLRCRQHAAIFCCCARAQRVHGKCTNAYTKLYCMRCFPQRSITRKTHSGHSALVITVLLICATPYVCNSLCGQLPMCATPYAYCHEAYIRNLQLSSCIFSHVHPQVSQGQLANLNIGNPECRPLLVCCWQQWAVHRWHRHYAAVLPSRLRLAQPDQCGR